MKLVEPPAGGVFRIGRKDRPVFTAPDWEHTGAGRFDDPKRGQRLDQASGFRIVYCATSLYGSFIETLHKFRPSLAVMAGTGVREADCGAVAGTVPASWVARRHWGRAEVSPRGTFVDCATGETFAWIREQHHLASIAYELGIDDIDVSAVTGPHRRLTQAIASYIHQSLPDCKGIRYVSRFGTDFDFECWAVFADRVQFQEIEADRTIPEDHVDLQRALSALNLKLSQS